MTLLELSELSLILEKVTAYKEEKRDTKSGKDLLAIEIYMDSGKEFRLTERGEITAFLRAIKSLASKS